MRRVLQRPVGSRLSLRRGRGTLRDRCERPPPCSGFSPLRSSPWSPRASLAAARQRASPHRYGLPARRRDERRHDPRAEDAAQGRPGGPRTRRPDERPVPCGLHRHPRSSSTRSSAKKLTVGDDVPLCRFDGNVLLIVNVASHCGNTPQYAPLQALYEKYRAQGFYILGFPSPQFGSQEFANEADVTAFCTSTYHITFPMFAIGDVNGAEQAAGLHVDPRAARRPGARRLRSRRAVEFREVPHQSPRHDRAAHRERNLPGRPRGRRCDRRRAREEVGSHAVVTTPLSDTIASCVVPSFT